METNLSIEHEILNSAVTIKSMSGKSRALIERIAKYCLENQILLATPRQFEILQESMRIIEDEGNKLIELCE